MNVLLLSTYELGRQPFGLASPAAWLEEAGARVRCQDLSVQELDEAAVRQADLVGFYVPMHTATRLAARLAGRIQEINPEAHLCFYGLYAPVNEEYLRQIGGRTILGGEFEQGLVDLVRRLAGGCGARGDEAAADGQVEPLVSLGRQRFKVPERSGLPGLDRYARLRADPGDLRLVGYTEASRGCKHLCRHCPIVPVYQGAFRVVQPDVVLADVRRQVAAGARHITFGDPDFFNGPGHAVRVVEALHREFPALTYDVTIKVEHLLKHREILPVLRDTGCLFVISAVEAIDEPTLVYLDKGHTRQDFIEVVHLFRQVGLTLTPTFVTFTPWTTLGSYADLLRLLAELELVDNVSPIQYAIRLLIPDSSELLKLPEVRRLVGDFDPERLCYGWEHPDPRVDRLHERVLGIVEQAQAAEEDRRSIFLKVWEATRQAQVEEEALADLDVAQLIDLPDRATVPYLTEPWYC